MSKKQTMLKVAMVGGGTSSFMGRIHREAIEASGCLELVCGTFGSTRQRSFESGRALGLNASRVYGVYREMFRKEAKVSEDERVDLVSIVAPNNMHYPVTMAAFDAGFPVFSEKPMSCNMDEAQNLKRRMLMGEQLYTTAYVYPFYPALGKLRRFIAEGGLGVIRRVDATYYHGWMGDRVETEGNRCAGWRTDPRRCGAGGATIDLAGPAFFAVEYVTGLHLYALSSTGRPAVPGRIIDDDTAIFLKFEEGAFGLLSASQVTFGEANGVTLSIFGEKGSVYWKESTPEKWTFRAPDGKAAVYKIRNAVEGEQGESVYHEPFGNNKAYIAALADSYREFAAQIVAAKAGKHAPANRSVSVDQALRVATFNAAISQGMQIPVDVSSDKWTLFRVPKVALLS